MNDIKEYLEKQLALSQELNTILKKIDSFEDKEKQLCYQETADLRHDLDKSNKENIKVADDRILLLKIKLEKMLSDPEIKKNADIFYPVYRLNKKLAQLSSELDFLEDKINKAYMNNLSHNNKSIHNSNGIFSHRDKINHNNKHTISSENKTNYNNSGFISHDDNNINNDNGTSSSEDNTINNNAVNPLNNESQNIIIEPSSMSSSMPFSESTSRSSSRSASRPSSSNSSKHDKKLEFKIGTNILNIIGAVLILISLITFGKYVFTFFMGPFLKGIFLFAVSGCILFSGEKIFKKKLPKFSSGISALGVGGLYASIMINYLILHTLTPITALLLTGIITALSLYLSYGDSSNIIRMISLLGAYMCLFPMYHLYGITSYITIAILITISIANGCFPIRNKIFLIYSSIINVAFCEMIMAASFLEEPALKIYLLATLVINNIMYMKLLKEDDSKYYAVGLISSLSLIIFILANGELILRIICLLVSIGSYFASKNRLRIIHFITAGLTGLSILLIYREDIGIMFAVLYISLMALTMIYQMKHESNNFLLLYSMVLMLFGMFWFIVSNTIEMILYGTAFAAMIWFLSDKYKNNWSLIIFKYIYLAIIDFIIIFMRHPFSIENNIFFSCALSIVYILLTNNIDKLKHDLIKQSNFILIILSFFICTIIGLDDIYPCLISLVLGSAFMVLFTSEKYIDNEYVLNHKLIIYSIYLTYGICALFFVGHMNNTMSNILLSIILMIVALGNVWLGFKADTVEVRRYGLVLSLIVCVKLLIVDFYSFDFVMKTVLFLVVGVIALSISYIYSKLENELKNKK